MRVIASLLLLASLGCGSAGGPWGNRVQLDNGQSVLTSAAQRIITNTSIDADSDFYNRIKPTRIICAEPSPDVAETVSRALGVAFQAALGQPPGAGKGSGQLTLATAASLAQLGERLATIQLLRDELSDLCRSYANGAVSTTTYTLRLAKLDRKMVTLLMGEMAAGAFGRPLGVLRSGAVGSTLSLETPAAPGVLSEGWAPSHLAGDELARLQQQFLSHDDLGTLLDACLTSLDLRRRKREEGASPAEIVELEDLYARRRGAYERVDAAAARLEAARVEDERRASAGTENPLLAARIALRSRELEVAELERRIAAIEAKNIEERSRLSEYCERDMPRIRAMIEARREDNAALRRLRSESRLLELGLPFCARMLQTGPETLLPESARGFCDRFFRSGSGEPPAPLAAGVQGSVGGGQANAGWIIARGGLNLRYGPSQASRRIAGLAFGSPVAVLQAMGSWSEVLADGRRGWVSSRWISGEPPSQKRAAELAEAGS